MSIESDADLDGMRHVGRIVALILREMVESATVGMTTADLDAIGASAMKRHGARSAPQIIYGFPASTCISVNDEIVHGIPGQRRIRPGDVVKIDVTAEQAGYIADSATTVLVPPVDSAKLRLKQTALNALGAGIGSARAGQRVSIIGRAVENYVRREGFAVLRELCGHGVGRHIHEAPNVPNYEDRFSPDMLTEGLVLAVEPMLASRPSRAVQRSDGWTISTHNGSVAVHEEHTVVIRRGTPLVLTAA